MIKRTGEYRLYGRSPGSNLIKIRSFEQDLEQPQRKELEDYQSPLGLALKIYNNKKTKQFISNWFSREPCYLPFIPNPPASVTGMAMRNISRYSETTFAKRSPDSYCCSHS